jgi:hypothetical protein
VITETKASSDFRQQSWYASVSKRIGSDDKCVRIRSRSVKVILFSPDAHVQGIQDFEPP